MEPGRIETRLRVRANIWAEVNEQVVLSAWRVQLLQAIEATGSIRQAAMQMNITYDLAWHRIDEMETALGVHLVDRQRGGPKGGCANLTSLGCELVTRFNLFKAQTDALIEAHFRAIFGDGDWRAFPDLRGDN
jgi:molybdate transport system regulatory protein